MDQLGWEKSLVRLVWGDLNFKNLLAVMLRPLNELVCVSHLMALVPALPATKEAGPA